jgi:hypothetical protein
MNERIRELVRQAGLDDADFPIENWDNVPLAKFAQLIVQECISMADKESERYSNLDQEYCSMAMDNYRELVRKHFGVEE